MFQIIDCHTGRVVGQATTLKGARRSADRRDMAYGAIRYSVRRVTVAPMIHIRWSGLSGSFATLPEALAWVRSQLSVNPALRSMPIAVNRGDCSEPAYILNAGGLF